MILGAILILFIFSLAIFVFSRVLAKPGYAWFIAVAGGLIAWVLILLSYPEETLTIRIMNWSRSGLFFTSPTLLVDRFSWPFAVAISTLLVSVLLTDVARVEEVQPFFWSTSLAITSFGLLSVLSANPLTLALTWAILDLVEILTRLQQVTNNQQREHIIISLATRILGSMLLILALFRVSSLEIRVEFPNIPPQVAGLFILAAGLRLGVLPPLAPYVKELPTRRGLGTLRRLIPVAASTILLTRVAIVGAQPGWSVGLVISASVALIYGSLAWVWAKDELDGRPFWILTLSAFTIIASVHSNPLSSQAWGICMIFSGGLLFLYSYRDRRLLWLPILGLFGFVALPFTPAWFGLSIFTGSSIFFWLIFIFGLDALIFGYFQHMIRPDNLQGTMERWVWIIYPLGLAILPLTQFWVMWSLGGIGLPPGSILSIHWWVGLFALVLLVPVYYLHRKGYTWPLEVKRFVSEAISLDWLYRMMWWVYRTLGVVFNYFLNMLDGDGGILWAVLIMILLLAFFVNILGAT